MNIGVAIDIVESFYSCVDARGREALDTFLGDYIRLQAENSDLKEEVMKLKYHGKEMRDLLVAIYTSPVACQILPGEPGLMYAWKERTSAILAATEGGAR